MTTNSKHLTPRDFATNSDLVHEAWAEYCKFDSGNTVYDFHLAAMIDCLVNTGNATGYGISDSAPVLDSADVAQIQQVAANLPDNHFTLGTLNLG